MESTQHFGPDSMVKSDLGWIVVLWPDFVRSVNNFEVDMFIHMLFIHTIYSSYSSRLSIHGANGEANFPFENGGNYAKRCGLMR